MSIKQKINIKYWLSIIYGIATLLTLFFIMAQAFLARQAMIQSNEWEKAKVTIENIEHFKEKLQETALYGKTEALRFSDKIWPDFSTSKGWEASDTLQRIYWSLFEDKLKVLEDYEKSLAILDAFAYPIIMGYANEFGSFQSVIREYYMYSNYIMPYAFKTYVHIGHHAKLLHRLWRVRTEQVLLKNPYIDESQIVNTLAENINNLLCFEGTEVTPESLKQYEKKLEEELKKIQKEIKFFRKNSMK